MAKSTVLPREVRATLVPQSLLGERYVQLYPAWVQGQPRLDPKDKASTVLGLDHTSVPVEPDEALAALKRLLDDLDPSATGRLITNLNQDLQGNGQNLNDTIKGLATLTTTLADKDQQLSGLIDNFAQFTTTLETRESQLGKVMDLFAQTTSLLAQERGTIATLVHNLGDTASNALDLVSRHGPALRTDISSLTGLLASLDANLGAVSQLLSSAPVLVAGNNLDQTSGLIAAYDPAYRRINLRSNIPESLALVLQALGINFCLPALGNVCPPGSPASATSPSPAAAPPATATATATTTTTVNTGPSIPGSVPGAAQGSTTTSSTQPPPWPTLPPITVVPTQAPQSNVAMSPLSAVFSLLASPGAPDPVQQAAYGLSPAALPAPHHGALACLARWSHTLLETLW
jgi:phospholipid/cholesterol/gamma-HCH transport system substrate-binding protein